MDENIKNIDEEKLKESVNEVLEKVRTQAMLLGGRSMAMVIANIIDESMRQPGKRSMNDMKRIVKNVRDFCQKAIDVKVEIPKFGGDLDANCESKE